MKGRFKKIRKLYYKFFMSIPFIKPKGAQFKALKGVSLNIEQGMFGLLGPNGAGKTTMICNLLEFYKGYFHSILIFSPTIDSDEKWDVIKEKNLLVENKPLKEFLKSLEDKKSKHNDIVESPHETGLEGLVNKKEWFDPKIPEEHFIIDYDDTTLANIMSEQKGVIDLLKQHGKPKYLANRLLIIFDDQVGSSLFSTKKGAYFNGLNTRHRHYSASFMIVSQGYKEIPKTTRTNWTCLSVFEIGNEKELEVIYEEFAMGLRIKDWMEVYRYCVTEPHGFMYFNFQQPRADRIMKNFTEFLYVKDVEDDDIPERIKYKESDAVPKRKRK